MPRRILADSRQPTAASPRPRRAADFLPQASPLKPHARRVARPGISLLEVLISMFVLLFGLLGVASIFPVGNHYAGRGDQYDRGAALSEAAFAELTARGLLTSRNWQYPIRPTGYKYNGTEYIVPNGNPNAGNFNVPLDPAGNPTDPHPGHVFVLDPLGASEVLTGAGADMFGNQAVDGSTSPSTNMPAVSPGNWSELMAALSFRPGDEWPIRRLTLDVNPDPTVATLMSGGVAETIFNLHDDLTVELPKESDRPGIQRWRVDTQGTETQTDDDLLARSYAGNYSWLATVVPTNGEALAALQPSNSMYGTAMYDVSVAVFHKRNVTPGPDSERAMYAWMDVQSKQLTIMDPATSDPNAELVDTALEDIRPGQWIAVAGVHPVSGQFLLKWYRLLSLSDETEEVDAGSGTSLGRLVALDGPDWPAPTDGTFEAYDLRAILLPGVIGVTTRTMPMQSE